MDETTRHKLIWGWLRFLLGWAQVSLAAATFGAMMTVGFHWVTWFFFAGATGATLVSRWLDRGQSDLEFFERSEE